MRWTFLYAIVQFTKTISCEANDKGRFNSNDTLGVAKALSADPNKRNMEYQMKSYAKFNYYVDS